MLQNRRDLLDRKTLSLHGKLPAPGQGLPETNPPSVLRIGGAITSVIILRNISAQLGKIVRLR
jgi:hypothetical protein